MNHPLKYIAAASLLLNVVLAGIFIGQAGRSAMMHSPMDEMAASLPADKRQLLKTELQKAESDTAVQRDKLNEMRKKAASLLVAEPFDQKAYVEQWKAMHDQHGPVMQRIAEAVADVAAQCTPQERAALADILRRPKPSLLSSPAFKKN